jgi:protein-S-isoprenylcysteine O-methyltransferase Ste14
MFLRALFAFLALPGLVALLVPTWIVWNRRPASEPWFSIGLVLLVEVMVAFHLRVVLGEEPWLARTHGAAWDEYKSKVPRWLL